MVRRPQRQRRRGAALVEFALILPILLLLTLGTIVGALGVFRHHQVAAFAREGARYAVVHGGTYQKEQSGSLSTPANIKTNVIVPLAVGFDTSKLTVTGPSGSTTTLYDSVYGGPEYPSGSNAKVDRVTVTVTYDWQPEFFLPRMNLTSTSQMLVWY